MSPNPALGLMWGLLGGYTILSIAALIAMVWRRGRYIGAAALVLAAPHALYYALFLLWPDALDGQATMLLSLALRYQVLFIGVLLLGLDVRRRWKR